MKQEKQQENKPNKRLPLNSDIVFKRVFSKEENKKLLKSLLQAILNIKIKSIEVKNPEIPRDFADSKACTLDIKAKVNENTIVNIEMQVNDEHNIVDRSIYYMVKTASNELKIGEDYTELSKTIVINILNFNYFKRNSFHSIVHLKFEKDTENVYINLGYDSEDETLTEKIEMHFIELEKFKQKNPNAEEILNQWLWLISGKEEKIKMAEKEFEEIQKAMEIINEMSMNSKEWELYESREKAIMNYNSGIHAAEKRGIEKRKKTRKNRNCKKVTGKRRKNR